MISYFKVNNDKVNSKMNLIALNVVLHCCDTCGIFEDRGSKSGHFGTEEEFPQVILLDADKMCAWMEIEHSKQYVKIKINKKGSC